MAVTFMTTTSHGTWLPGDLRGYVRKGITLPGDSRLLELSRQLLQGEPVYFNEHERDALFDSLVDACREFDYRLTDVTVESWHLHWIVWHGDDGIKTMAGRLKTRMRQKLARGRVWTEGHCGEPLYDDAAIAQAQAYIASHDGCRITNGIVVRRAVRPG
jgi:REP element-mobilizing transposase RayT